MCIQHATKLSSVEGKQKENGVEGEYMGTVRKWQ